MKYFEKISAFLLLCIMLSFVSESFQSKKIDCRKYVYAPKCRGVAAKRALPRLHFGTSSRQEPTILDPDTLIQWKDKDKGLSEKGMLRIIFKKTDDINENYNNHLN